MSYGARCPFFAFALAAIFAVACAGCVSDVEHERVTRELLKAQLESAQRAGEITALRQMLYYNAYSSRPESQAATTQAAIMQLARAYSDLAQRYGALSVEVTALKQREETRTSGAAAASAVTPELPRRASSRPFGASDVVDPFRDR